ncbi:hypothetical protein Pla123a_23480 [Posidoniimonas polymericola]|uniref:Uncharacterized protein n=1 Tax=Posidoniimonas polymericola TaxID=2528002 RepID=A0A5C5YPX5_9BACT|nr:hypothetical protein [Posidoniimonas polymericola]TWT76923.1 hypothetical protein Pla123a_23480 [Posidoniimonas polymericola]
MSSVILFAALAATGITYEWRPQGDPHGGHEYVVTVEPELMQSALDGDTRTFRSDVPDNVKHVSSVVVKLGEGAAQPQRHGVLKPPVLDDSSNDPALDDEEFAPIRHTVRQQTYPPQNYSAQQYPAPNSLEAGFNDWSTTVDQQRKSIGSELTKVGEKLVDETGRAFRNGGQMVEGTIANANDGLKSLINPGVNQTAAVGAAPQPGSGYTPYSYNQPTNSQNGQPTYPPAAAQSNTPSNQPYGSVSGISPTQGQSVNPNQQATGQQNWNSGAAPPPLGANPPQNSNWQNQAPTNQSPYPPSNQQQPNRGGTQDLSQYASTQGGGNGQAYTDFSSQRDDSYDERFAPIGSPQNPSSQNANSQNASSGQPTNQGQAGDSPWPSWPTTPAANTTPPQTAQYGGAGNYQQQNASYPPAAPGDNPADWGTGNMGAGNMGAPYPTPQQQPTTTVATDVTDQKSRSEPWWYGTVALAAIGSIAWNFYLGMNYIDARNKYRAALRRSGRAYSEVLDDM